LISYSMVTGTEGVVGGDVIGGDARIIAGGPHWRSLGGQDRE
jgi:hypothetical protein